MILLVLLHEVPGVDEVVAGRRLHDFRYVQRCDRIGGVASHARFEFGNQSGQFQRTFRFLYQFIQMKLIFVDYFDGHIEDAIEDRYDYRLDIRSGRICIFYKNIKYIITLQRLLYSC